MKIFGLPYTPGGYFQVRRPGSLDLTSSLEAKFGARSGQVHQIRLRRKFGKFCYHKTQKLGKSPNFGVIFEIQRAKFGLFVIYISDAKFGAPTRISEANFGAKPPRPPNMKVPLFPIQPFSVRAIFFCSCRYHALFSFRFISYMGRFWFGFVQLEIGIISYRLISLSFLLACGRNLMDEGWNDVKYREIACILNLIKGRTKNRIDLPPNLN